MLDLLVSGCAVAHENRELKPVFAQVFVDAAVVCCVGVDFSFVFTSGVLTLMVAWLVLMVVFAAIFGNDGSVVCSACEFWRFLYLIDWGRSFWGSIRSNNLKSA